MITRTKARRLVKRCQGWENEAGKWAGSRVILFSLPAKSNENRRIVRSPRSLGAGPHKYVQGKFIAEGRKLRDLSRLDHHRKQASVSGKRRGPMTSMIPLRSRGPE